MAVNAQVLSSLSRKTFLANPLSEFLLHSQPQIRHTSCLICKNSREQSSNSKKRLRLSKVMESSVNTPVEGEICLEDVSRRSTVEKNKSRTLNLTAIVMVKNPRSTNMKDVILQSLNASGSQSTGEAVVLQLVSTELDPQTKEPRLSRKAALYWSRSPKVGLEHEICRVEFTIDSNFGMPGALTICNKYENEFFLKSISIEGFVHFDCNSWIQPAKANSNPRVFFANKAFLPSQTPAGLKKLRERELQELRGDGNGIRLPWDRVYDYDMYNDLGDPDKGIEYGRPTLGGEENPHPRRCRTGRPPTNTGTNTEIPPSAAIPAYVPRDEELKDRDMSTEKLKGIFRYTIFSLMPKTYEEKDVYKFSDADNIKTLLQDQVINQLPIFKNLSKIQCSVEQLATLSGQNSNLLILIRIRYIWTRIMIFCNFHFPPETK